ncbi:peptide deformylase [Salinisphaera orenii MK-B5]|uniref:Peptide deformylase n=1 Tax=Salinisphaera orenii MK-B5 TaxID=856730 RepID=A0A423PG87_9GAMM|nr:peptide deformylase [Salinisphaera orenii]ROO24627.1 peptide deformylase [Salinisphaera orenii MK-B5]
MAILEILHFPDPRLRETTEPVTQFDAALSAFVDDMFETMYDAPGVGLAATQVGDTRRVAVMDCSDDRSGRIVMCNPRILSQEAPEVVDEGCLSVPEHYDRVERYTWVRFAAQDRDGEHFEMEAEGLLAQCVQHELAHLDGGLYIDKLSRLKRERIRRKLAKAARHAAEAGDA